MNMNVRLEGMSETILDKLIELGYFKSKNDAIRVGLVELAIKYNVMPTKEEIEDYYYSMKAKEVIDKVDEIAKKNIPIQFPWLRVPMLFDASVGINWGEMKETVK